MKQLRIISGLIIISLLSFFWIFPQVFRILYAKYVEFELLETGTYSSVKLTETTVKELLRFREMATQQVVDFWGDRKGNADVFYCDTPEVYNQLCQSPKGSGCSVITPFGSWIILNFSGMNEGVIAHEMCHDELATRLGWWKSKVKVPKWLDEGIALQVDNRFVMSADSIQRYIDYKSQLERYAFVNPMVLKLTDLQTEKQFFGGDGTHTQLAYLTAATQVAKLISIHGKQNVLNRLIDGDVDSFTTVQPKRE